MQKHGEVAAHLAVALGEQGLAGAADHHPISLLHRYAEQCVPDGAANQIHLHR
jgi:hypothetical protein